MHTERSVGKDEVSRMALRSYVSGSWVEPTDQGAPLFDAVTGEVVSTISSSGVDAASALQHGRTVGGPAVIPARVQRVAAGFPRSDDTRNRPGHDRR